jgi:hypothetical protein
MGDAKQLRLASRSERRSAGRLLTRAVNCYRIIAYPETYLPRELGQLVVADFGYSELVLQPNPADPPRS